MASLADSTERRDALVERLFRNAVGAFDLFSVYIGERLGLYRVIADEGDHPRQRAPGGERADVTLAHHPGRRDIGGDAAEALQVLRRNADDWTHQDW